MKIESIRETLRLKAQNMSVPSVAAPAAQNQPVLAVQQSKSAPKQEQSAQKATSVVIPMTKAPEATLSQQEPIVEAKPPRKPVATRRAKGKGKAAPLSDIEAIIAEHLRAGIDYTTLMKCNNKSVLLKGGAEHLASLFGFRTKSEIVHREFLPDTKFLLYEVSTTVYNSEGDIVAVGLGSANTLETRYIKQGLAMSANTVLKMARKRSYVDAILSASSVSRIFTQDIEELVSLSEDYQDRREA